MPNLKIKIENLILTYEQLYINVDEQYPETSYKNGILMVYDGVISDLKVILLEENIKNGD